MAKNDDPIDLYLRRLGAEALNKKLTEALEENEDEYPDDEHDEEEEKEDDYQATIEDVRSEVYQMSQHVQMFTGLATEGKAEIGDIRRRLEEMRLKLDLIQKNILDTTKELKEQFTGFDGLVSANQQLQEGMRGLKNNGSVFVDEAKRQIKTLTDYNITLKKQIEESDKRFNVFNNERSQDKHQIKQLRKANHELRTERNKLEGRLEQLAEVKLNEYQPLNNAHQDKDGNCD